MKNNDWQKLAIVLSIAVSTFVLIEKIIAYRERTKPKYQPDPIKEPSKTIGVII
jgi:hypothetical protein